MKTIAPALLALALVGCHQPEQAPPANARVVVPAQPPSVDAPSSQGTAGVAASASDPSVAKPTAHEPLPAPKPSTIPLAKTGDAALDAKLAEGDAAFEAADLDKAFSAYESAKKAAPKRAAPIVGVARVKVMKASPSLGFAAAEKNADIVAATKELKRASALEPTFGPAHVELGRALLLLGDAPRAEVALRQGVLLMGGEAEAHSALGVALLATGKAEDALVELTKAKDLDPGSAARRGNLGTVLFMRGKVAEAIKEYEIQARLAPDDARAHSDLGTALLAQSDFFRAIPELKRAIGLDPKRATFHSNLGYGLQLEGKVHDAIAEYREALRLDPKLTSAWINLATALARDPKTRVEAREALKTAGAIDPTDPRVKPNLEELDALERGAGSPAASGSTPATTPKK